MKDGIERFLTLPPNGPLNGYLVLEIGGNISGPMATEKLAREGAQVIKIELTGGDPARSYLSHSVFASCNAAKASIAINKANEKDKQIYRDLLRLAKVIVDNRSPDAKKRDEELQEFLKSPKPNPVIFCSIVGYDSQDNRPALDVRVQAEIGMAKLNGINGDPLKLPFVVIDITTGWEAASNIKSHLLALERFPMKAENKIIFLEQSMAKTGAMLLSGQYLMAYTEQKDMFREGNRDLWIAPFSFYKTKDDMISLAIIGDRPFVTFCDKVINLPELAQKYPTNQSRLENSVVFEKELTAILQQKSANEWITLCQKYGIVCSKINSITEMLKEPFGPKMISFTTQGTPIIADPCFSSAFPNPIFNEPPKCDEHRLGIVNFLSALKSTNASGQLFGKAGENFDEISNFFCNKPPSQESFLNAFALHSQRSSPTGKTNMLSHSTRSSRLRSKL